MRTRRSLTIGIVIFCVVFWGSWATGFAQESGAPSYVVQPGDTLSAIARAQGSSVEELQRLNSLSTSVIRVGQTLRLSEAPAAGVVQHEVRAGETLSSLAARYGLSETSVQLSNPALAGVLSDAPLVPGLVLLLPPAEGRVLSLAPGESLLTVALRFGLAPAELARFNPESSAAGLIFLPEALLKEELPAPVAADGAERGSSPWETTPSRTRHRAAQQPLLEQAAAFLARYQPPQEAFVWPLSGSLSSRYGRRNLSVGGNTFHGGIDIAAPAGTEVRAARSGTVSRAGWAGAYGYAVYVEHADGSQTRYAHLSHFAVTVGRTLAQSEVLGYVGSTGASTGPHLHFELRFGGRTVDPLGYLP